MDLTKSVNTLARYRILVAGILAGITILLFNPLKTSLIPNNELSIWFDKDDPAMQSYYEFQEEFGNDRMIFITYKEHEGVFSQEGIRRLLLLNKRLEKVKNVNRVISWVNLKDFQKIKQDNKSKIVFLPWVDSLNVRTLNATIRKEIMQSSLVMNHFINPDTSMVKLIVQMDVVNAVDDQQDVIIGNIQHIMQNSIGMNSFQLNGAPITSFELNQLSRHDFVKFTGLCYLIIFLLAALYYRNLYYLVIISLSSLLCLWYTFGIYGALGFQVNIFTVMTPPIAITLSVIVLVHILNKYQSLSEEGEERVVKTLNGLFLPCLYAAITTMVGFLSLTTSNMRVLREFGALNAFASFLAWVIPFVVSALLLPLLSKQRVNKTSIDFSVVLDPCLRHVLRNQYRYLALSLGLFLIFLGGFYWIRIDMHPLGYFPQKHKVVQNHEYLTREWGDYFPMTLVLVTQDEGAILDQVTIKSMIKFNEQLHKIDVVSDSFSYINFLERYSQVLYKRKLAEVINNPFLLKSYQRGLQRLIENEDLNQIITQDNRKAKITVTGPLITTSVLEQNLQDIEAISVETMRKSRIEIAGYPALFIKVIKYAFESMRTSLFLAVVLIFIIILTFLHNVKIALIAMLPNLFPIIVLLGFLGFSGINLDLATCTIAAIIIGVAIDDTIHMLYGYMIHQRESTLMESMTKTHSTIAPVVLLTSILLICGFSVLMFSALRTVYYFGLISTISIVAVLYGDLIVLPLLYRLFSGEKKD